jgi:hypothetical protein
MRTLAAARSAPWRRSGGRDALVPTLGLLCAVAAGALLPSAAPGAMPIGILLLALLPLATLFVAGAARAAVLAAALLYVAAFDAIYISEISPTYAYSGMADAGPAPGALLVAAAIAALPAAWLPLEAKRPSVPLLWALYLIGYVPGIVLPLMLNGDLETVLPWQLALMAAMALAALMVRLPPVPIALPSLSLPAFTAVLVGLSVLSSLYIAATFGIRSPPSLADVYVTRDQFSSVESTSFFGGYIVPWAAHVIQPMLFALGLARRRIGLVLLALGGMVLIYADTGFRTVLFSVVIVPLAYLAITHARRWFGLLAAAATPVIVLAAVAAPVASTELLGLTSRTFATPAQINWYYFDYFSDHQKYQLSHSFLGWLYDSPYSTGPPDLIGPLYFAPNSPHANASLWGDAFANFGFAGVAAFSVIFGVALLVADGLGRGRDLRVAGPMLAIMGLTLSNSALFTTILTQGLALAFLLVAVMPKGRIEARAAAREPAPAGPGTTARSARRAPLATGARV